MTFSTPHQKAKLSITKNPRLSIATYKIQCHYKGIRYAECRIFIVMLDISMLNVIQQKETQHKNTEASSFIAQSVVIFIVMLNYFMLNNVKLSVVMLSVLTTYKSAANSKTCSQLR